MDRVFGMDGPLMRGLSRIADVVVLNLLTLICCVPIVTIGAALTAQHYVALKMARNEEGYVVRLFFKSFKQNFKQATCIWLIFMAFIVMFALDVYIFSYSGLEFPKYMIIMVSALGIIVAMGGIYVFPVLARFENTVKNTLINSFKIAIISLPKTILMLIIYVLPILMVSVSLQLVPIVALFGLSGTAYVCAMLYNGIFKKFEPPEENGDSEKEKEEDES